MRRYRALVTFGEDEEWPAEPRRSVEVHEERREPVFTGLLDANGVRIYRVDEREPIGFKVGHT